MRSMTESAISIAAVYDREASVDREKLVNYETIKLEETDGGVWELVLTNPPANALSKQMAFELRHAVSQ